MAFDEVLQELLGQARHGKTGCASIRISIPSPTGVGYSIGRIAGDENEEDVALRQGFFEFEEEGSVILPDCLRGTNVVFSVTSYAESSYKAYERRGVIGTGNYSAIGDIGALSIYIRVAPAAVRDILFRSTFGGDRTVVNLNISEVELVEEGESDGVQEIGFWVTYASFG